jgi:hypothetical protein
MQIIAKGWSLGLCLTFQIALVHFLFNDLGIAHFVINVVHTHKVVLY